MSQKRRKNHHLETCDPGSAGNRAAAEPPSSLLAHTRHVAEKGLQKLQDELEAPSGGGATTQPPRHRRQPGGGNHEVAA